MPDDADILHQTILALVRADQEDLTFRQLAVFLTTYLSSEPQTVRGLATHLNVAKPTISRALDRLEEDGLVKRLADQSDGRSLIVGTTPAGAQFLRDLKSIVRKAAAAQQ